MTETLTVLIGNLSHTDHTVCRHAAVQLGTLGDVSATDSSIHALRTEREFFVREYSDSLVRAIAQRMMSRAIS